MMLQNGIVFASFIVCANSYVNIKCFQWIYNDGSDCSTYIPALNLLPLPEIISTKTCCKDGTCFSNTAGSPWECHLFNPDCIESIKPEFTIYTSDNYKDGQSIDYANVDDSLKKAVINSSKSLYVIVHGFGSVWPKPWMVDLKNVLIPLGHNVMLVRWTKGAGSILQGSLYIKAAANTQAVGKAIANVVNSMVKQNKAKLSTTTIIGHSLGAHISGYAGNGMPGLNRIIGLDPAGPMFACQHADARLDETDAEFVEVIHTNGDTFALGGAGTLQQLGTVDFYPNGGWLQPGCNRGVPQAILDVLHPSFVFDILKLNFTMLADDVSCNHVRAITFLYESIKNAAKPETSCKFTAFPCDDGDKFTNGECFTCKKDGCTNAGLPITEVDVKSEGKYFFKTFPHNISGFCGSEFLISLTSNVDVKGSILIEFFNEKNVSKIISFQNDTEYLTAKQPKQIVAITQWEIQNIVRTTLTYNRYISTILLFPNSGTRQWTLKESSITDSKGRVVKSKKDLKIEDGVNVNIAYS